MESFKDGDKVQQYDGYGRPRYVKGEIVIRTCVSYEKYKANLEKYGDLQYVTIDTCINNPKRFKKLVEV